MKIINLDNYEEKEREIAIALGNFDGIHLGHKYLIKNMIRKAKVKELKSSVLLFKNHTKNILKNNGDNKISIITSNNQKIEILRKLGIEIVYTMDFNKDVMKLTGEEFVKKIITGRLNSKLVTIGFDYKFGYKAMGDSDYLKMLGLEEGFSVDIISPISLKGEIISSTTIRELIMIGNMEKANRFLGHFYTIEGIVVSGKSRGKKLGYPTANVRLNHNYIVPKSGVYKTNTIVNNQKYASITNIGNNPTFKDNELKIETHILNFNEDIYGNTIKIEFVDFIREDIKFDTVENLVSQIKTDIQIAKQS